MSSEPAGAEGVLSRREGGVAWVTLNRPDRLNAFAGTMRDDLHHAIADAAADSSVRVIVITGAGRAFCSGADIGAMEEMLRQEDEERFAGYVRAGMRVVREIRAAPKPVIAAVNGAAAGAGASLALACDVRVASESAAIGITFGRIGLHPDWGSTYFLPRLAGAGRAAELTFTGRMVSAAEAERIGLFDRVFPATSFAEDVAAYAAELAAKPPLALAAAKRTLRPGEERELDAAMEAEAEAQIRCFRSADVREGIAAFREKRAPSFTGDRSRRSHRPHISAVTTREGS